jgi:hypothetical protein
MAVKYSIRPGAMFPILSRYVGHCPVIFNPDPGQDLGEIPFHGTNEDHKAQPQWAQCLADGAIERRARRVPSSHYLAEARASDIITFKAT